MSYAHFPFAPTDDNTFMYFASWAAILTIGLAFWVMAVLLLLVNDYALNVFYDTQLVRRCIISEALRRRLSDPPWITGTSIGLLLVELTAIYALWRALSWLAVLPW